MTNEDYAQRAVELGHGVISSCEHGYQGRYIETFELHQKYDLKFLFGAEAYWVWDRKDSDGTNCHIFLGARNEKGRQAINDVISEANISGFYRQARLDPFLILSLPPEDVIVTTACIAFWKYDGVEAFVQDLKNHFGNHFYLEVQYHNTDSQKELNRRILKLHETEKIPLIMGCDSHYILGKGAKERTNFLYSKGMEYPDEKGWYLDYPDGELAWRRFEEQGVLTQGQIADAMDNTNTFLDIEEYDCACFHKNIKCPTLYPGCTVEQKNQEYEKLVWKGWEAYKTSVPKEKHAEYLEEIRKEIDEVKSIRIDDFCTADYFIDDYYIIRKGIENGGVITPTGRGSGVSFFTNKLLGFTDVDRIAAKVKMYPERFMSATRILEAKTLPDLDINVADQEPFARAQQEILGEDHAYPMIAYGTNQVSAAWKLFAKSQDIDFETSNEVSKQIKQYEEAVKRADEDDKESIDVYEYIEPKFREIFEGSKKYRGLITSWSIAPCSYLLYQGSIRKEIGLVRIKGHLCCLMDGHWAEDYKFLKNDLLKVKVVDMIDRTYKRIGIPKHSVQELLEECTPENKVWDIYRKGCTVGINQVEQPGTSSRVGKYAPTSISELCAFIAAIRPGFKSMYKKFESRLPFSYGINSVDDLIQTEEMPQSFILYQEMSMAVLNYAGIPMSECHEIIKSMSKKRIEKVLKYKERFLNGMEQCLMEKEALLENEAEEVSANIWKILEDSSSYAFNACVPGDTRLLKTGSRRNLNTPVLSVAEMYEIATDVEFGSHPSRKGIRSTYHNKGYGTSYSMFSDNEIYINDIKAIFPAGNHVIYRITTENGSWIKATINHKFPTKDGIKPLKFLHPGTVLYTKGKKREKGLSGFAVEESPIVSIDKLGYEDVYDIVMSAPAYNFVNEGGIVALNSHSYCVAIDSLYGAYLKTYYPLQYYETYLRIQEESGEKDKMAAAKEEAERYFKIKFPPFRFGQDNRSILLDEKNRAITNSLSSIKGFGKKVGEVLYAVSRGDSYESFMDVLLKLAELGVKSKVEELIRIDYFEKFGNSRELLRIWDLFTYFKHGTAVSIKKSALEPGALQDIIARHANGLRKDGSEAASYKILNMPAILHECEAAIKAQHLPDFSRKTKIADQTEILGYFCPSGKEEERPILVVQNISPLVRKRDGEQFGFSYFCKSVGSGIQTRFTVVNQIVKKCGGVEIGDIILCTKKPTCHNGFFRMEEYRQVE